MHELILDLVRDMPTPYRLARLPLDDGALVSLFSATERPRWIAKTATNAAGIRRLRAEARALGWMETQAEALGVPRLLGWREEASGDVACLVQSGVTGRPAFGLRRGRRGLPFPTHLVGDWLQRFQCLVISPRQRSVADVRAEVCRQADADAEAHPGYAALLDGLLAGLQTLPLGTGALTPSVAVHGDFWAGNVLLAPAASRGLRLRVIDWSGFDDGTGLEDMLTWMAFLDARRSVPEAGRLQRWRRVFFVPGPARDFLRDWSQRVGYAAATARLAFYLFLLRRLSWELGLCLQARSPGEQARARQEWTAVVAWLAQNRYPDPFSATPA